MSTGVLLMAHGSPGSLDEVEEFLRHVMKRRPPSPAFVEEIRERYRKIGGRSPLLEITRRQAAALAERTGLPVFVGMRHWKPWIADAVAEAKAAGVDRLVAIPLAPQYAPLTTDAYHRAVREAMPPGMEAIPVTHWHQELAFLQAWADRLPIGIKVLFTAHSIPVENSDPYPRHIKETIQGIKFFRPEIDGTFAYQSRSPDLRSWLEPDVLTVLKRLAAKGTDLIAFAPIGFVSDHIEVLYDLDILHSGQADELGMRPIRIQSLNDHPLLIEALASVARRALAS